MGEFNLPNIRWNLQVETSLGDGSRFEEVACQECVLWWWDVGNFHVQQDTVAAEVLVYRRSSLGEVSVDLDGEVGTGGDSRRNADLKSRGYRDGRQVE